jgi:hypothetical protein
MMLTNLRIVPGGPGAAPGPNPGGPGPSGPSPTGAGLAPGGIKKIAVMPGLMPPKMGFPPPRMPGQSNAPQAQPPSPTANPTTPTPSPKPDDKVRTRPFKLEMQLTKIYRKNLMTRKKTTKRQIKRQARHLRLRNLLRQHHAAKPAKL